MGNRFAELAFTPNVQAVQEKLGSRASYRRLERGETHHQRLGARESAFIARRDSFYMATVSETGWPYVQHRGGPQGFLRVLDDSTVGFADFAGNRQYVSVGNLAGDGRIALIMVDYPNRARLKILGHARTLAPDHPLVAERLAVPGYRAAIERGVVISIAAFDWNCRQHITPRYRETEPTAEPAPEPERRRSGGRPGLESLARLDNMAQGSRPRPSGKG